MRATHSHFISDISSIRWRIHLIPKYFPMCSQLANVFHGPKNNRWCPPRHPGPSWKSVSAFTFPVGDLPLPTAFAENKQPIEHNTKSLLADPRYQQNAGTIDDHDEDIVYLPKLIPAIDLCDTPDKIIKSRPNGSKRALASASGAKRSQLVLESPPDSKPTIVEPCPQSARPNNGSQLVLEPPPGSMTKRSTLVIVPPPSSRRTIVEPRPLSAGPNGSQLVLEPPPAFGAKRSTLVFVPAPSTRRTIVDPCPPSVRPNGSQLVPEIPPGSKRTLVDPCPPSVRPNGPQPVPEMPPVLARKAKKITSSSVPARPHCVHCGLKKRVNKVKAWFLCDVCISNVAY